MNKVGNEVEKEKKAGEKKEELGKVRRKNKEGK